MVKKKRGKKENGNSLKSIYSEVWDYLKESKVYIYWLLGVFLFFAVVGFIFPTPEIISNEIMKFVEELMEMTKDLNAWQMILFIFKNNIWSSLVSLFLGVVLGIIPLMAAITNGYLIGYISKIVVAETSFWQMWRLLPHGIFEIPAIIISLGLGVKLGWFLFAKKPADELKRRFRLSVKTFFLVVLPLLVVAAIIEGVLIVLAG